MTFEDITNPRGWDAPCINCRAATAEGRYRCVACFDIRMARREELVDELRNIRDRVAAIASRLEFF